MAAKRVTMQQIADACGLSRNTVSKVFNGRGHVPEVTRRQVLEQAQAMGFRQLPAAVTVPANIKNSVALLTHHMPGQAHFGSPFVSAFTNRLSRSGYTLRMYEITPDEKQRCALPANFEPERTAGILGIELFDRRYSDYVCALGLPTIFSDTYARADLSTISADIISMENTNSSIAVTAQLISSGCTEIGFVGDKEHCNSFYERWNGYRTALARGGCRLDTRLCILEPDSAPYCDVAWLVDRLDHLPHLPQAFFCANDYLAVHLMEALKYKGLQIPADVRVAGFDGSPESGVVEPHLTTVKIPSAQMGYIAAGILLERITQPDLPFRSTYIQTTPVWRQST